MIKLISKNIGYFKLTNRIPDGRNYSIELIDGYDWLIPFKISYLHILVLNSFKDCGSIQCILGNFEYCIEYTDIKEKELIKRLERINKFIDDIRNYDITKIKKEK